MDEISQIADKLLNDLEELRSMPVVQSQLFEDHPELLFKLTPYAKQRRLKKREIYRERREKLGLP